MDNSSFLEHQPKPTTTTMATDQKLLREKMAQQLGDAGLQCLAQITVAASTTVSNIKRLDYKEFDEDDYEYYSDVDPLVKAIKEQCSAIVDAYKSFSNGEERFTMVLKLSEIVWLIVLYVCNIR